MARGTTYTGIELQNLEHLLACSFLADMSSVALLPEELAGAEEGLGVFEFPTDDAVPLVELEREVAVAADPFGVVWGRVRGWQGGKEGRTYKDTWRSRRLDG